LRDIDTFRRCLSERQINIPCDTTAHRRQQFTASTADQRRAIWVTYLRVGPRLDPSRDDPRFADLLKWMENR
jgi:hypothetical protein